jgi:TPR repeat protein
MIMTNYVEELTTAVNHSRLPLRRLLAFVAFFLASACSVAEAPQGDAVFRAQRAYAEGRYVDAIREYEKAAQTGSSVAMFQLGVMTEDGRGVAADLARAAGWYEKAADAGSTAAMKRLGNMYLDGAGLPKDADKAAGWYQRAGDAGDKNALFLLGQLYWNGSFGKPEPTKAVSSFKQAARLGDGPSINALGIAYRLGEGVPENDVLALAYFRLARERGVPAAHVNAEDLARKLAPEEVSRADALVAQLRTELSLSR